MNPGRRVEGNVVGTANTVGEGTSPNNFINRTEEGITRIIPIGNEGRMANPVRTVNRVVLNI